MVQFRYIYRLYGHYTASTITSVAFGVSIDNSTKEERKRLAKHYADMANNLNNASPRFMPIRKFFFKLHFRLIP